MTKLKDVCDQWLEKSKDLKKAEGYYERRPLKWEWFQQQWAEMHDFIGPGKIEHGSDQHIKLIEQLVNYAEESIKLTKQQARIALAKEIALYVPTVVASIASILYIIDWILK